MMSRRIDERDETELCDLGQPSKSGRIDHGADPRRERHIKLRRYPDQTATSVQADNLRQISDRFSHDTHSA